MTATPSNPVQSCQPKITDLLPCPFCKNPPGTKVGPPAMARCVTPGCDGTKLAADTLAEWNTRAAPAGNAGVRRIEGATDIVDEAACLIWAELCPGLVMGDTDRQHYENAAKAVLALPQPPETFADEIKRADAGHPITNPLVLPAGIKAGDYASLSPIPEAPGREWQPIETAPRDYTPILAIEDFTRVDDNQLPYPPEQMVVQWSEKSNGWASFGIIIDSFQPTHWMPLPDGPRALKPQDGGNCEHGIAKVNCGICVPSEVFSGESGS